MSEEQKSEEGKRMFSIFAARMFEQRVLQAYREKVAQERQLQLLRELEEDDKLNKEREAKKQTQNQKKKDKKKKSRVMIEEPIFEDMSPLNSNPALERVEGDGFGF